MSKDLAKIFEGNWDELQGKIKKEWGKLTDDDIEDVEGSYDKLVGKIKKAYGGLDNKTIIQQIHSFLDNLDLKYLTDKGSEEEEGMLSTAKEIKSKIEEYVNHSLENIKTTEEDVVNYIKQNPVKSVLFTTLIGALVGKLYFTKKK